MPKLVVIFDNETTGLIKNRALRLEMQPEVIEFYGCLTDLETGEIKEERNFLVKPSKLPLEEIITKITGITDADLTEEKPFATYADDVASLIERAPMVIAHNLAFDKDMLDIEFERLGRKLKWPAGICTIAATRPVKGYALKMGAMYEWLFNEQFAGAHRAKADVMALHRCCVELNRRAMI